MLLSDAPRTPDDPDYIEFDKVKTDADAVLHVYYHRVGLYSGRFSTDYLPRVNIGATLYSTERKEELYGEHLYYGVDARAGKDWSVTSDPRYAWPSFEAVMEKSDRDRRGVQGGWPPARRPLDVAPARQPQLTGSTRGVYRPPEAPGAAQDASRGSGSAGARSRHSVSHTGQSWPPGAVNTRPGGSAASSRRSLAAKRSLRP